MKLRRNWKTTKKQLKKFSEYYRMEHSQGDFKNGITLEIDGNVCQIVEFQHVKPGKGAAFVRTKYKNIITGAVLEKSFRPTEKFPQARIERVDMQYL